MKRFLLILVVLGCVHPGLRGRAAERQKNRTVNISTLCLLDDQSCRNSNFVAQGG